MKLLPSLASVALTYEQPKYDDFLRTLGQKKNGWGAPTGRIAALWSLCPPLTTPTNGQVVCDQATCALVCDSGLFKLNSGVDFFLRIHSCWQATNKMSVEPNR